MAAGIILTSCKKDKTETPTVTEKRVSKFMNGGTANTLLTYNSDGSLAQFTGSSSYKILYDYSNNAISAKVYSYNVLDNEAKNAVISNSKLQSIFFQQYNNGNPSYSYTYHFSYNTDGTMAQYDDDYSESVIKFAYTGGNFTKVMEYNNAALISTRTYEYYTDKPNKFNLPFQEYFQEMPILAKDLLGKKNANLMKKIVSVRGANTYTTTFTYQLDAEGYVTQFTQVSQKNNDPSNTYVIDVVY